MKKIITTLLAAAMVLSLCACGGSASAAKSEAPAAASSAKSEAPAAAASSAKSEAPAAEASSAAAPEVSADGPSFNFKFASTENEGTLRYQMIEQPVMDLITEKSNGRITFTFFGSSTLAGSGQVIKGMQDGTVDFGLDNINSYPSVFLYSEMMTTPGIFLGADYDEKADNINAYSKAYATQEYKDNGVYLIGTSPALNVVLMSKFAIENNDSFNGKTICVNGALANMFENTGAAITWTVPPEQYEALHLNVIDATINGSGVLQAFKLYEVLDHAYYIPFSIVTSSIFMSQKAYDSLPDDLKAVMDEIQNGEEIKEINKAYVEAMTAQVEEACAGNPNFAFADLPDDVSEFLQSECAAVIEAKAAELNAAGLDGDGALELLNSFSK